MDYNYYSYILILQLQVLLSFGLLLYVAVEGIETDGSDIACHQYDGQVFDGHIIDIIKITSLRTEYLVNPLGVDRPFPRLSWKLETTSRQEGRRSERSFSYEHRGRIRHRQPLKKKTQQDQRSFSHITEKGNTTSSTTTTACRQRHSSEPKRGIFQHAYQFHIRLLNHDDEYEDWIDCGWKQDENSNHSHLVPLECDDVTPLVVDDQDIQWKVSVKWSYGSLSSSSSSRSNGQNEDAKLKTVTSTEFASFRTGLLSASSSCNRTRSSSSSSWKGSWINGGTLLRKEVDSIPEPKQYATLYVSGLGYYQVYINGIRVGKSELDPGWTDYTKRVWYSSYNVTDIFLKSTTAMETVGPVVVSAILGNGWWSCGPKTHPEGTGQPGCLKDDVPQLIFQLHVDGIPIIVSDESWKVSNSSPIVYDSLYNGEIYDGRIAKRMKGWMLSGYIEDSTWSYAKLANDSIGVSTDLCRLSSQLFEPIGHINTYRPVKITVKDENESKQQRLIPSNHSEHSSIIQTIDFGRNLAAIVRLKRIVCPMSATITLRHAEVLMHPPYGEYDGSSIYVENLRDAKATDVYICNGDLEGESYTPHFTQHGFRYVEVLGLSYQLDPDDIEMVEVHTDLRPNSVLKFSDALLNDIQNLVTWGLKSNLMSVQTDCTQRDERRGWMGDAALTAEAAAYNFEMGAFYTKWLDQMVDAQSPDDGSFPDFVPSLNENGGGAPNWQTAYVTILRVLALHYGDLDVLNRHHDSLVRYFEYLEQNYSNTGIGNYRTGFGDWVPPPPHLASDRHLMGAFAFVNNVKIGIELFRISNHADAQKQLYRLRRLWRKVKSEFHTAFFNETTNVYMSGLQTEQILPLYLGVVPSTAKNSTHTSIQERVLTYLVNDIQKTNKGHTTSGIVGIKHGMEVLSNMFRGDVAMDLALQTTYPSWGYMLHNKYEPATTSVWELWNSDTAGPGMNSRNHHMFGSISSWFYKHVVGIQPSSPGFSKVDIKPNVYRLDNLSAVLQSPYGNIEFEYWRNENMIDPTGKHFSSVVYELFLPPGTAGSFLIPISNKHDQHWTGNGIMDVTIYEDDGVLWTNEEHRAKIINDYGDVGLRRDHRHVKVDLSNGFYRFEVVTTQATLKME